eukprot:jgi/Bigna1/144775/aug1.91_g19483
MEASSTAKQQQQCQLKGLGATWVTKDRGVRLDSLPGGIYERFFDKNLARNILLHNNPDIQTGDGGGAATPRTLRSICAHVGLVPRNRGEQAGIFWYFDDDNYAKLVVEGTKETKKNGSFAIVLAKEEGGKATVVKKEKLEYERVSTSKSKTILLRLEAVEDIENGTKRLALRATANVGSCGGEQDVDMGGFFVPRSWPPPSSESNSENDASSEGVSCRPNAKAGLAAHGAEEGMERQHVEFSKVCICYGGETKGGEGDDAKRKLDNSSSSSSRPLRIVAISDTHNMHKKLKIPSGDVLIHCGDFTNKGTEKETEAFGRWLASLPHPHKIVVEALEQLKKEGCESRTVKGEGGNDDREGKQDVDNKNTQRSNGGGWGQNGGVDVFVSHEPPHKILDGDKEYGCPGILDIAKQISPRVMIFGHIHEGHGITKSDRTLFINAAVANPGMRAKKITYDPVVFDITKDNVEVVHVG